MIIRTNRGETWYTVSDHGGTAWREAEPLRTRDGGDVLQQPASPCPVFALARGDYLFLFNANDGYAYGATSTWDVRNRRPAYLCRGEFRPGAHQPIWWSEPKLFIDNANVIAGVESVVDFGVGDHVGVGHHLAVRKCPGIGQGALDAVGAVVAPAHIIGIGVLICC